MIEPGERNRVISVQVNSPTTYTAEGEPISSWSTLLAGIWAKYEPISGREYFLASQRYSESVARFTIEYTTYTLNESMRIKFGSDYYEIRYIKDVNDERSNFEILAEKIIV